MITRYHVENFKQLKNIECNCKDINIIIGPNGAGKSSLLQSIDFLKAFSLSSVNEYLESRGILIKDLLHRSQRVNRIVKRTTLRWNISLELPSEGRNNPPYKYKYEARISEKKHIVERFFIVDEDGNEHKLLWRNHKSFVFTPLLGDKQSGRFLNPNSGFLATVTEEESEEYPDFLRIKNFILNIQTFLIWDPEILRQRSRGNHDELGPNGQNLATILAELKRHEPAQFDKMIKRLQKVLPNLNDIVIKGSSNGWKEINIIEKYGEGSITFNNKQISDGTLRLIAMALIRYGKGKNSMVSFEEPENGVHPPILRESVRMIDEITQLKPKFKTQVFITTHNPHLLDLFQDRPETIFIMEKGTNETGAVITNLTEQHLKKAKLFFDNSIGDLWFSSFLINEEVEIE
jgi:predicted ATPase